MGVFDSKNWKVFLALSVIIPVGLVSAFKLAGLLSGSVAIAETRTLEPAKWEFEKPDVGIFEICWNSSANEDYENVSVSFFSSDAQIDEKIIFTTFLHNSLYGGSPAMSMVFEFNSSVPRGYVAEVNVTFREDSGGHSDIYLPSWSDKYENLSFTGGADGDSDLTGNERGFFTLTSPNRSVGAFVGKNVDWVWRSEYNQTNFLFVDSEVTYFNGTVFKRIVQPFQVEVDPHFNNSFETAEEIGLNQTRKAFIAGYGHDTVDYYKTWLQNGASATWQLVDARQWGEAMEIRVYDPDVQLRSCLLYPTNSSSQQLTVTIDKTGWWYVRLDATAGEGLYRLKVLSGTG